MFFEHSYGKQDQRPVTFKCINLPPVKLFEFIDFRTTRSRAVQFPGWLFMRGNRRPGYGPNE
jgi:hypothetical protein